ncbi:MAG TPA: hypothetical protein VFX86_04260 [Candidatus Saccharimonadales bacterium]|nr:hypothetical protein [Candidatus Saccharimonadales bacterium]
MGIIGNGGQANEAESYLGKGTHVIFRAVSANYLDSTPGLIDLNNPGDKASIPVVAAVGPPGLRRKLVEQWPSDNYATVIAKNTSIDKGCIIDKGSIIAPGSIITTDVNIGLHTIINIGATISHNCKVGDFVTISPGAHIAGNVELGDGVFIGIGATVSNGIRIASGVVIGAGAVVIHDINEANSVVVGNPAKPIKVNQDWLNEI